MLIKRIGYCLVCLGLLGVLFSLGADVVGLGKKGFQAAQLLGVQVGLAVLLAGAALLTSRRGARLAGKNPLLKLKNFIDQQPLIVWTVAGFIAAYLLFFITPMFLNDRLQFQYFYRYLPDNAKLGLDMRTIIKYVNLWLVDGKSPYFDTGFFYPPLYNLIIAPVVLSGYPTSFYIMLILGIASYFGLALLPVLFISKINPLFVFFFFLSGLFSYGLQFELERAQFNLVAFFFCLFAVYIYHFHEDFRYFAYLFFSISVQLKIYPLIFIVMFIKDWRDWKNNLLRMAGLALFNFALLFVLGYQVFLDFIHSIIAQVEQAGSYTWVGNHSIKAFVFNLTEGGLGLIPENNLVFLRQYSHTLEFLLSFYVAICLITILVRAYLRHERGLNPYLLVACTIGAMVIPAVSQDYKLVILEAPLAIVFNCLTLPEKKSGRAWLLLLVFLVSFAYSCTLYPFKYRPEFLANSFPLLIVILSAITIIYQLSRSQEQPIENAE